MNWEYSGSSIQKSLSNFNAVQLIDSNIYQISYYDNLIAKILSKMEIKFSTKFITQEDLRKIIGDTKK